MYKVVEPTFGLNHVNPRSQFFLILYIYIYIFRWFVMHRAVQIVFVKVVTECII